MLFSVVRTNLNFLTKTVENADSERKNNTPPSKDTVSLKAAQCFCALRKQHNHDLRMRSVISVWENLRFRGPHLHERANVPLFDETGKLFRSF